MSTTVSAIGAVGVHLHSSEERSRTRDASSAVRFSRGPGIELAERAILAPSLDELYFILTNDARALIDFDRAAVISHLGKVSTVLAISNEAERNQRSEFIARLSELGGCLRSHDRPLLLSRRLMKDDFPDGLISPNLREDLKSYMAYSGYTRLFLLPLPYRGRIIGHLLYEFSSETEPAEKEIRNFLRLALLFALAMAEKTVMEKKGGLKKLFTVESKEAGHGAALKKWTLVMAGVVAVTVALFFVPFPRSVGGEVLVRSRINHMAFCRSDGLIETVFVREGDTVCRDQLLARLDPKEIDFQMATWKSQQDVLSNEMNRLTIEAGERPARLADKKTVELKKEVAQAELRRLAWKRKLLDIPAPVSGTVLTRDVEALAGKKLRSGEAFCEIAGDGELVAHIYVPEERIGSVKIGQNVDVYLNAEPTRSHRLTLSEIAPRAEVRQRHEGVYKVTALFPPTKGTVRVGMKGIGKIQVGDSSLWHILVERFSARWHLLALYL